MSLANWHSQNRRVVVTGLGAITPLANNMHESWKALIAGESAAGPITLFDASEYPVRFACEVKDFQASDYIPVKELRKMDRFMHLGIAASMQAWEDAGFKGPSEDNGIQPERLGIYLSSGMGGLPNIETQVNVIRNKGPKRISPFFIPSVIPNLTSGHLTVMVNAKGHNACVVSACASGAHSIGESAMMISRGDLDVMLAGGCESVVSPCGIGGFAAMKALSTRNDDPKTASRPYDKDRDGFVMGEGGGTLVLESYEHAQKRGARIYAEVLGYGTNSDAYHFTSPTPDGSGARKCMQLALDNGKIDPQRIGYINSHGTSTPAGDQSESMAVEDLFGDHAKALHMSSTKSMIGHLLGGSGGVEACISIMSLVSGELPPTINLENVGENCNLNYVPNEAIQKKCEAVMSNSFGFGGTNASLVFGKV